ncbi:MAG TPA: hypothetical protein DEV68_00670 [Corynebacterium flavescens]|nr:hypothetical protein [Corynebacterium flavescens]
MLKMVPTVNRPHLYHTVCHRLSDRKFIFAGSCFQHISNHLLILFSPTQQNAGGWNVGLDSLSWELRRFLPWPQIKISHYFLNSFGHCHSGRHLNSKFF